VRLILTRTIAHRALPASPLCRMVTSACRSSTTSAMKPVPTQYASASFRSGTEHERSTKTLKSHRRRITMHAPQRSALLLNRLMHGEPVRSRLGESLQSDQFPIAFQLPCRCNTLLSFFLMRCRVFLSPEHVVAHVRSRFRTGIFH
jgi:hypothetical protein